MNAWKKIAGLFLLLYVLYTCNGGYAMILGERNLMTAKVFVESRKYIVEVKVTPLGNINEEGHKNQAHDPEFNHYKEKYLKIPGDTEQDPPSPLFSSQFMDAGAVRIYRDPNFHGESKVVLIRVNQCVNLPYEWRNVGGVDALGLCVLLWESSNCNGRHKIIWGDGINGKNLINTSSRMHTKGFASLELC